LDTFLFPLLDAKILLVHVCFNPLTAYLDGFVWDPKAVVSLLDAEHCLNWAQLQ
jgi:hypothetical protein